MKNLYFFWFYLNWLEFVTYVIIPSSILLVILVYIYFNLKVFRLSMHLNDDAKQKIIDEILIDDFEPKKLNLIIVDKVEQEVVEKI